MNTQKLNDDMFGTKPNYVKPLMILAVIILLVIIALATVTKGHAMGSNHVNRCQEVLSQIATPHTPLGSNPHPACVPLGKGNNEDNHGNHDTPSTSTTATSPVIEPPTTESPVINDTVPSDITVNDTPSTDEDNSQPPTVTEDKPKCNNGEGNGSEGCSPAKSPNANNDENQTTPKEDKSGKG